MLLQVGIDNIFNFVYYGKTRISVSHMCLTCAVVASSSPTQEMVPFTIMTNIFHLRLVDCTNHQLVNERQSMRVTTCQLIPKLEA